jgi:ATP-dependent RNA helicase DeaD
VNLGTADGLGPGSVATALEDAGAPVGKVLRAELRPTFGYVFVAEEDVAAFETLNGKQHGTKTLRVEKSKPRSERTEDRPRPAPSPDAGPGEVKLWVNLGMDDSLDEAKFIATLEALGAPAGKVLKALLRPTYGYAYVAEADAPPFEALLGKPHGEKALKIERHRPRGSRDDRRRERREETPEVPGQTRLWVGLGKQEGLDEAGVTAALEGLGAPAGKVARVELRPTYAYVFVAEEDVAAFEALNGKQHGEKTLKIERAKRR